MAERGPFGRLAWLVGWVLGGAVLAAAASAQTATPPGAGPDAALEERVNRLASELRCLVCQNQTIADSHAELAVQLKGEVRTQLAQGRSEDQVRDFMVQRYGEFVLYRPALNGHTTLLWAGPGVLLIAGLGLLAHHMRQRRLHTHDAPDSVPSEHESQGDTHPQEAT